MAEPCGVLLVLKGSDIKFKAAAFRPSGRRETATTKRTSLEKVLLLLVLVLGVSLAAALYRLYALNPLGSMFGMYQTEWTDGAFYNAQFFNKDQYYLEVDVALQTSCEKFSYNLQKRNGA